MGMTHKQKQVLDLLTEHEARQIVPPSYKEIAAHVGLKSKSGVVSIVRGLEARGYITRIKNCARSLQVVERYNLQSEMLGALKDIVAQVENGGAIDTSRCVSVINKSCGRKENGQSTAGRMP